jgi:hypothetical protein
MIIILFLLPSNDIKVSSNQHRKPAIITYRHKLSKKLSLLSILGRTVHNYHKPLKAIGFILDMELNTPIPGSEIFNGDC